MFGFPQADWKIMRLPTPATEGNPLLSGTSGSSNYSIWATDIQMKQAAAIAGIYMDFFVINTWQTFLIDANTLSQIAVSNTVVTATTSIHTRYFYFPTKPLLPEGGTYRIEIHSATPVKGRYTNTFFNGNTYKELRSWIDGTLNNSHFVMQLAFARAEQRIWYKFY